MNAQAMIAEVPPTSQAMNYEIRLDDFFFFGPDGPARILVEGLEVVHGPNRPNWQPADYLVRVIQPFTIQEADVEVTHLLLTPRYDTDTVDNIMGVGCTVGVAYVNPGCAITSAERYTTRDMTYWSIGNVSRLDA